MSEVFVFALQQHHVQAPVRHCTRLDGAPSSRPGVTAVAVRTGRHGWCILADHPRNPGVSVTNGVEEYAGAVCRALSCDPGDLAWFEIDSTGAVDEVRLTAGSAGFAPLCEPGQRPRSVAAFLARAARLPGGLPSTAAAEVTACSAQFAPSGA